MKIISLCTLGLGLALNAHAAEFISLFKPYEGKTIVSRCGKTLAEAKAASPENAALEFSKGGEYGAPYVVTHGSNMIYVKSLDASKSVLRQSSGDVGGSKETVWNSMSGKIFKQETLTKEGIVWPFIRTTEQSVTTIDFTNPKSWIYKNVTTSEHTDDQAVTRFCILEPQL